MPVGFSAGPLVLEMGEGFMKTSSRFLLRQFALQTSVLITFAMVFAQPCLSAIWIAGSDLVANERPNGPQELVNPNPTVPEWSYGSRSGISGTAFSLLSGHINDDSGYAGLDGWFNPAQIEVNTGASPIITNFGFGPNAPLGPGEMYWHPSPSDDVVLRWTAPFTAIFTVNAYWGDLDPHGGNGASGDVVLNGLSIFHQVWANGGGATTPTLILPLVAGDKLDFVEDAVGGNHGFDATRFNATIEGTAVPEPSTFLVMAAVSMTLLLVQKCGQLYSTIRCK